MVIEDQKKQGRLFFFDQPKESTCELTCPRGSYLETNLNHVPFSNGCGSYNIHIDFSLFGMDDFNKCCDVHDYCKFVETSLKKYQKIFLLYRI